MRLQLKGNKEVFFVGFKFSIKVLFKLEISLVLDLFGLFESQFHRIKFSTQLIVLFLIILT